MQGKNGRLVGGKYTWGRKVSVKDKKGNVDEREDVGENVTRTCR